MAGYDPDKQAVYYAESVTFNGTLYEEPLHTDDFMELADRLFNHDWWTSRKISTPFIESTTAKDRNSYASVHLYQPDKDPIIRVAPHDINPRVLAHEAAHVAQFTLYQLMSSTRIQSHGVEFRKTYLEVARILLGSDAANDLLRNFTQHIYRKRNRTATVFSTALMETNLKLDVHEPGIFPTWYLERQANAFRRASNPAVTSTSTRLNGAIAL